MKKALLLALVGLFAAVAPAVAYLPPPANVNFSSERGVPFGLVLDGRPLTRGVARQVRVDQLVPGMHWADFTVPTAYGGAVRFRSRVWLEPGLETSFVLIARPGRPLSLRQVAAVPLCAPNPGRGSRNGYYDNGYGGGGGHFNNPVPYGHQYPSGGNYPYNGGGYGSNGHANGYGNAPAGAGYYPGSAVSSYRTLPPQEVDALVRDVQQRPFEATKLSVAKEALRERSIQTDDLQRLLHNLEFEASRVELAKFAYPHVVDPQNFDRVYDEFEYDASVQEIQQAVRAEE
jgi:hypothetical protein